MNKCEQFKLFEMWYQGDDEEDEDLMCSPAILARRASESWINVPPVEVILYLKKRDNEVIFL